MLKKVLTLLLALLMLAFALVGCTDPQTPPEPEPEDPGSGLETPGPTLVVDGEFGTAALTWELYSDGTLYIKGEGEMGELERGEGDSIIHPWYEYMSNHTGTTITKVVVESGVTSIASGAFMGCTNLREVDIARTVSVIPEKCFKYCEKLERVTASCAIRIEDNAFDSCVKLSTVTFSASLELVGDGAFLRAGEESKYFSVRLAGTAEEWEAAKAAMDADENDEYAIWTGNEKLLTGLENPSFVEKGSETKIELD